MEGEQKGNRKQKVTGVLSDVGSKINFEVGRLATKDRWERQTEREREDSSGVGIGLSSLLSAALKEWTR